MKLRLIYIQSSKEPWAEMAESLYAKKLKAFGQFEVLALKAKSHSRAASNQKKHDESVLLVEKIDPQDINILFDEKGQRFSSSIEFSDTLKKHIESSRRLSFFIGGAFGVDDQFKSKFTQCWSFSALTMNHHLAKTVAFEQIYRGVTIIKGLPYHNN
ncbi:MAG: 23S rRNA (pseudouridine(1915)-N(3))-methyltransferase RlmH [Bdellovibrionales bacterium]|nr:23S rRNA (pseudouridine(1915)-N(3))-methyltransferase RlmH [Bdellovibrionales bacterium]